MTEITAHPTGPGRADIIAHYPPCGDVAGFRAIVGRAERLEGSGRWQAVLYGRAYPASQGVPSWTMPIDSVNSIAEGPRRVHTLRSLMGRLRDRGDWWSA